MDTKYAVIWFEGTDKYTLVNRDGSLVSMTEKEAARSPSVTSILRTEADVENAQANLKHAISFELMENLFGV